jgi:hypothetical protein
LKLLINKLDRIKMRKKKKIHSTIKSINTLSRENASLNPPCNFFRELNSNMAFLRFDTEQTKFNEGNRQDKPLSAQSSRFNGTISAFSPKAFTYRIQSPHSLWCERPQRRKVVGVCVD